MLADGSDGLKSGPLPIGARPRPARSLLLFPGALGDTVCLEPTAAWLAGSGPLTVYARGASAEVARLFPCRPEVRSLDSPEIARLFAPPGSADERGIPDWLASFDRIVSFTGSRDPNLRA